MQVRLAATDLACLRGDRLLFRGLTLALEPSDALHITGANGIGKSSLLRILAGLLRPFSGEVHRQGSAALLDERPALDPDQPLSKALGFWAAMDGHDACAQVMRRLALDDLADVPVQYLSTGQRKRAALARVTLQAAPIWLLDEPMSGLDARSRRLVETAISEHCAGGGVCAFASHQTIDTVAARQCELGGYAP
ncbi:Cytochrome c bioproteinis ATP-binding export protein CcmA [Alteripontixanthobacter maritimus]|uniref:Cytochrome c bioproteinis ATP-binding export protein CcmA n=1 Tax=Alteripontixanthobacter maritimus TaxID=2161824 RepID=A0A369Q4A7_9SPHN|nr:heme ABC exporter ATP-binding protein CcmA [Alteripontixanthobacter maritimus]RDC59332.1 Cytochrome c bioproteinis ATP-binding export protein CcmA [Alteripontixanthobacter maritimus]